MNFLRQLNTTDRLAPLLIMQVVVMLFLQLVFVDVYADQQLGSDASEVHRIVGGDEVPDETKYPFMAAIYSDSDLDGLFQPICGGALLSSRWVVTAAHCLFNESASSQVSENSVAVLLGEHNLLDDDGSFVAVKRVVLHPGFDYETDNNDIALLELAEPYFGTFINVPSITSYIPEVNDTGIVIGWGSIAEDGALSFILRETTLDIVDDFTCFKTYKAYYDSTTGFCAGGSPEGGKDSCQGDSGGPLFVNRDGTYVLAGIVSYGSGCGRPDLAGVYTRVSSYVTWLQRYVNGLQVYSGLRTGASPTVNNLSADNTLQGFVEEGKVVYFNVQDSLQVNLHSNSGDADLLVFNDVETMQLSNETLQCTSELASGLDICPLNSDAGSALAIVYGYTDSSFTITSQTVRDSNLVETQTNTGGGSSSSSSSSSGSTSWWIFVLFFWIGARFWVHAIAVQSKPNPKDY